MRIGERKCKPLPPLDFPPPGAEVQRGEGFALPEKLECEHSEMNIRMATRARVRAREIDIRMMLKTTMRTLQIHMRFAR